MKLYTQTCILFVSICLCSCSYQPRSNSIITVENYNSVVNIQPRDLIQQSKIGNGEGLAKPVPGQPLLVNNQLIFSTMGDAVLGIAITVGAIKQTADMLMDIQPLPLEQQLQKFLVASVNDPQWQLLLSQLLTNKNATYPGAILLFERSPQY